jgi:hypothetical protein
MLKSIKDIWALNNIASTYLLSNIVKFPQGERYQININTFIKCLVMPENPIGNVFIIQGGVLHMNNSNSYYVTTTCSLLPKNLRVFVFETLYPACNYEFAHDIASCLTFIKREFPGKTCLIGYSLGGVLLYTYLSLGYDQADLYIPVCCPLDMDRFLKVISEHALFKILQKRACDRYNVKSYEDLLKIAGSSKEKSLEFNKTFIQNLNSNKDNWIPKTIYILSSNDPITRIHDLDLLEEKPLTYIIQKGWHCCGESILLTVSLARHFIETPNINIKDLPISYGPFDVINNLKK